MEALESNTIMEILTLNRNISSEMRVSSLSYIYDPVWDFSGDLKHRPRSISLSMVQIDWSKWNFSKALVRELQKIHFLLWKSPSTFSRRVSKANSFCCVQRNSLNFLDYAIRRLPSPNMIESVSQIDFLDLKFAAMAGEFGSSAHIKRGLKAIFDPAIAKLICTDLKLSRLDIGRLNFKPLNEARRRPRKSEELAMPDELFHFMSENCSFRVKYFLERMGVEVEDQCAWSYCPSHVIHNLAEFKDAYQLYSCIRKEARLGRVNAPYRFLQEVHKVNASDFNLYIEEVNACAQFVLGQYLGARFSELSALQVGCRKKIDGIDCIVSRNFKGRADVDNSSDCWVSIPIMRDAVAVLELLADLKGHSNLISPLKNARRIGRNGAEDSKFGNSYSGGALNNVFTDLVARLDVGGKFQGYYFNSHQFKHSLAGQFVKARLGLPYISFHLKHLYSAVITLPSNVTLGYGNARSLIQSDAAGVQLDGIKRRMAEKLLSPDTVVAGGAASAFDSRRKSFFTGMTDQGASQEQIIDEVASLLGSAFVNVGAAYCTGRKYDPKSKAPPPCVGSLKCNPVACSNAIVTKDHAPVWKRIYAENIERSHDPRFAYGSDQFLHAAEEALSVLVQLGEPID